MNLKKKKKGKINLLLNTFIYKLVLVFYFINEIEKV